MVAVIQSNGGSTFSEMASGIKSLVSELLPEQTQSLSNWIDKVEVQISNVLKSQENFFAQIMSFLRECFPNDSPQDGAGHGVVTPNTNEVLPSEGKKVTAGANVDGGLEESNSDKNKESEQQVVGEVSKPDKGKKSQASSQASVQKGNSSNFLHMSAAVLELIQCINSDCLNLDISLSDVLEGMPPGLKTVLSENDGLDGASKAATDSPVVSTTDGTEIGDGADGTSGDRKRLRPRAEGSYKPPGRKPKVTKIVEPTEPFPLMKLMSLHGKNVGIVGYGTQRAEHPLFHGKPVPAPYCVMNVTEAVDAAHLLPFPDPDESIFKLGDVVGSLCLWPKRLVKPC